MQPLSDFCRDLGLRHPYEKVTCIGYCKNKPTCNNLISGADRSTAVDLLQQIQQSVQCGWNIEADLNELSRLMLCKRWHSVPVQIREMTRRMKYSLCQAQSCPRPSPPAPVPFALPPPQVRPIALLPQPQTRSAALVIPQSQARPVPLQTYSDRELLREIFRRAACSDGFGYGMANMFNDDLSALEAEDNTNDDDNTHFTNRNPGRSGWSSRIQEVSTPPTTAPSSPIRSAIPTPPPTSRSMTPAQQARIQSRLITPPATPPPTSSRSSLMSSTTPSFHAPQPSPSPTSSSTQSTDVTSTAQPSIRSNPTPPPIQTRSGATPISSPTQPRPSTTTISSHTTSSSQAIPTPSRTTPTLRSTSPVRSTPSTPPSRIRSSDSECGICLDAYDSDSETDELWECSRCRNRTHQTCFDAWMTSLLTDDCGALVTCVYCRAVVLDV